jgi:hypothetical protein
VRGTYDRYEYRDEKAQGFEALAALIAHIVNPQLNVIPLRGAGVRAPGDCDHWFRLIATRHSD